MSQRFDTISFLSDYGRRDEFVGVVHSVVRSIAPAVAVLDITHDIAPYDVRAGGLALARSAQYLVPGVVLAVVDPGVGTGRRAVAVEVGDGQSYLVGPDNGLLAPAVAMVGGATAAITLDNPEYHLASPGPTFDGRDVFGPAAAVLAAEQAAITDLGPPLPNDSLTPLLLPLVEPEGAGIRGEVWWLDQFGNCQTNVSAEDLTALGASPGGEVTLQVGGTEYELPWVAAYGEVEPGQPLLHLDSYGLIAIAVREGSAAERLNLSEGHQVVLQA